MTTDYAKLKVTELKELLTARSLPVSGKKEELVARLVENDANDLGDLAPPEEEYDWETPSKSAVPASKPTAAPAQPAKALIQPGKAPQPAVKSTTVVQPAPPSTAPPTSAPDASAVDIELEKRKKRAERFGIPLNDNVKKLERTKRFGEKRVLDDPTEAEKAKKRAERFKT
jgi:SAP domain-containing ribonucleoprotein